MENFDMRMAAISMMRRMNRAEQPAIDFNYPVAGGNTKIDGTFWRKGKVQPGTPEIVFYQYRGTAFQAVSKLETTETVAECITAVHTAILLGAAKVVGEQRFNAMHSLLRLRIGADAHVYRGGVNKHYYAPKLPSGVDRETFVRDPRNWIPGDWMYMKNKDDYINVQPGGLLSGENCLYIGKDKDGVPHFSGFGLDNKTEEGMRKALQDGYEAGGRGKVEDAATQIRFTSLRRLATGD
jgi:hypothetical protein